MTLSAFPQKNLNLRDPEWCNLNSNFRRWIFHNCRFCFNWHFQNRLQEKVAKLFLIKAHCWGGQGREGEEMWIIMPAYVLCISVIIRSRRRRIAGDIWNIAPFILPSCNSPAQHCQLDIIILYCSYWINSKQSWPDIFIFIPDTFMILSSQIMSGGPSIRCQSYSWRML